MDASHGNADKDDCMTAWFPNRYMCLGKAGRPAEDEESRQGEHTAEPAATGPQPGAHRVLGCGSLLVSGQSGLHIGAAPSSSAC